MITANGDRQQQREIARKRDLLVNDMIRVNGDKQQWIEIAIIATPTKKMAVLCRKLFFSLS